jgi:hypothetical protein
MFTAIVGSISALDTRIVTSNAESIDTERGLLSGAELSFIDSLAGNDDRTS